MRGKLRLKLEDLDVESFTVPVVPERRGTVHAFISEYPAVCHTEDGGDTCNGSCHFGSCDYTCDYSCGWSCGYTCDDPTCNYATCYQTCNHWDESCAGSCGGTCCSDCW